MLSFNNGSDTMRLLTSVLMTVVSMVGICCGAALAETQSDGSKANARNASPAAIAGMAKLYHVTAMCSVTGSSNNCGTAIEISNLGNGSCDVGVEFYNGRSAAPSCTATFTGLVAPTQATICSRAFGDPPASCNSTCATPLTFNTGFAIVYSSCKSIGVQATIYTKSADDTTITGSNSVNLIRYRVPPDTKANQGD